MRPRYGDCKHQAHKPTLNKKAHVMHELDLELDQEADFTPMVSGAQ